MLFNSSIRKELAQTFAAILTVLLTIIITVMLIRTLSMASKGAVSPQDVMLVLAYIMLGYIPILLSIALLLTIVFVLARMYRDSEMVIWQSSGAGTLRLFKPILTFSWSILLGITILMIFVWPWSNSQITAIGLQFKQRSEISMIQPGQFQKSSNGKRVIFIESQQDESNENGYFEGKNAFLLTNDYEKGKSTIITAQTVHIEEQGDDRFLVFNHGQQIEFDAVTKMRSVLTFEKYTVLASDAQEITNPIQKSKELPTEQLLRNKTPNNMGELFWRFGLIIAAFNFIIIAIPLGYANPRVGRNTSALYAILTAIIYYNLINLGRNSISNGKLEFGTSMFILHGSFLCIAIFFILKRHYEWRIFPSFLSRSHSKTPKQITTKTNSEKIKPIKKVRRFFFLGHLATVKRLFYSEIFSTIFLVALGFLSLFFFFDLMDDIGDMGKKGYQLYHVLLRNIFQLPSHLYDLMPIVILIGTIFVLARMAQNSEFTILRTSGLSPTLALKLLATVGIVGAITTFVLSDFVVPAANNSRNQLMEAFYTEQGDPNSASSSAWLRDRDENYTYAVSIYQDNSTQLRNVMLYTFDQKNQLVQWVNAPEATIEPNGTWLLKNAIRSTLINLNTPEAKIIDDPIQDIVWKNNLTENVVSIATYKDSGMNVFSLYQFIQHLSQNAQASETYLFNFWQKILYPFSCLVMVMLALPFAYLHFRSGGISGKIFAGVMIGVTFIVINNMFGHLGQLHHWPPLFSAGMPSLIYLILSFVTFSWLVKNR